MIEALRYILLHARLAVVQYQAEAVALVSRTLLGAVGDVAAIGRIERRRVAGGIVGGDVLGRASADRDDPQVVIGGSRRILVVIRGVADLLAVGREGIVILPAEGEDARIVVAGGQIAGKSIHRRYVGLAHCWRHFSRYHEDMSALAFLVGIPMPVKKVREHLSFNLRLFGFF